MRFFLAFILGISTLRPEFATAAPEVPAAVVEAVQGIREVGIRCPDRVWPGYSWKDTDVYFVHDEKDSFHWNTTTDEIRAVETRALPESRLHSIYEYGRQGDRPFVSYSFPAGGSDRTVSDIRDLLLHEQFHAEGQRGWETNDGVRGTKMPMRPEPRYQRAMLHRAARDALLESHPKKCVNLLREAKGWFERWRTDFPAEFANYTDLFEGTAQFVEVRSSVLADLGCEASDAALIAEYNRRTQPLFEWEDPQILPLDAESYAIGNIVTELLRRRDPGDDWARSIPASKNPFPLLFDPLPDPGKLLDQLPLREAIERLVAERNRWFDSLAGETLRHVDDPDYVRVLLPGGYNQGNLVLDGFFTVDTPLGEMTVMPFAEPHRFRSPNGRTEVSAGKGVIYLGDPTLPKNCVSAGSSAVVLVKASAVKADGKRFRVSDAGVEGVVDGKRIRSAKGLEYLCPK